MDSSVSRSRSKPQGAAGSRLLPPSSRSVSGSSFLHGPSVRSASARSQRSTTPTVPPAQSALRPMKWSSTHYDNSGRRIETFEERPKSPDQGFRGLTIDELCVLDVVEFGRCAPGSVRLDFVSVPSAVERAPSAADESTPSKETAVASSSSTTSNRTSRYVSPYSLREPVVLRLEASQLTIERCSTNHEARSTIIASFPYGDVLHVDVRKDGSLHVRRADGLDVSVSMHSHVKVLAAYKVLVVRCRGGVPQRHVDDVQHYLSHPPPTDDASHSSTVGASQRTPSSNSRGASSTRAHMTSIVAPLRTQSPRPLTETAPPLPNARSVPNRLAKTPVRVTIAAGEAHHADPGKDQMTRVQHSSDVSSQPLAAREERRDLLRAQLLELKRRSGAR